MTNYRSALVLAALIGGAACADDKTPPAGKPAASNAATAPAARAPAHYVQAAGSSLGFSFEQAGAQSSGTFRQFATTFDYDPDNLAASKLDVKVQIGSLDTQDKDRDGTLASAELFDAQKHPTATYTAARSPAAPRGSRPSESSPSAASRRTCEYRSRSSRPETGSSCRGPCPSSGSTSASGKANGSRPSGSATR
jgi:hypothetical protein